MDSQRVNTGNNAGFGASSWESDQTSYGAAEVKEYEVVLVKEYCIFWQGSSTQTRDMEEGGDGIL